MSNESQLCVRQTFTAEFKREALELIRKQGLSVGEAARRLDVRETLLRRWRTELEITKTSGAGQPTALEAEVRQLREEVRRLTMGREILKSGGILREGVEVRYASINDHRDHWPVAVQCDVLGESRSG